MICDPTVAKHQGADAHNQNARYRSRQITGHGYLYLHRSHDETKIKNVILDNSINNKKKDSLNNITNELCRCKRKSNDNVIKQATRQEKQSCTQIFNNKKQSGFKYGIFCAQVQVQGKLRCRSRFRSTPLACKTLQCRSRHTVPVQSTGTCNGLQ